MDRMTWRRGAPSMPRTESRETSAMNTPELLAKLVQARGVSQAEAMSNVRGR